MNDILIRKGDLDTGREEKTPCEDRGRDWSDASTGQEIPRIASNHQKLGERHGTDFLSGPLEGTNSAHILVSGFQPPEL